MRLIIDDIRRIIEEYEEQQQRWREEQLDCWYYELQHEDAGDRV